MTLINFHKHYVLDTKRPLAWFFFWHRLFSQDNVLITPLIEDFIWLWLMVIYLLCASQWAHWSKLDWDPDFLLKFHWFCLRGLLFTFVPQFFNQGLDMSPDLKEFTWLVSYNVTFKTNYYLVCAFREICCSLPLFIWNSYKFCHKSMHIY